MLPLLAFIAVPVLGVVVVAAEGLRRNGETRFWRHTGRILVAGGGIVLAVLAGLFPLSVLFVDRPADVNLWVFTGTLTIATLLLTALFALAARSALRVAFARPAGASVKELARSARDSDELRLFGWILILAPLLQLGIPGLIFVLPVLLIGIVWWTARRAREAQFLWVLALAVENDLPVDDEVEAFAYSLWSPRTRISGRLHDAFGLQMSAPSTLSPAGGRFGDIANRIREGRSLLDVLELSGMLSRPLVAELREAQAAGKLPRALRQAATATTATLLNNRLDGSVGLVTVYVWTLLVVVFSVVAFLMYWIIPKYIDIFHDFDVELPAWTVQAIHVSDAIVSYFYLVMPLLNLPILAGAVIAVVGLVGWGNLNYPLLMRWFPRRDAPSLVNGLAYAVEAGRPLTEAIGEMAEHEQRRDLRERLERMQQLTQTGDPLWTVLAGEGFITRAEGLALEAAARAGNLAWGMRTLADSMLRLAGHRVRFWLEFVKPVAVIAVGCVVAFFVIAFFLPLVKLISDLTQDIT